MMDIRDEIVNAVMKEVTGPYPNPDYLDELTGEEILLANVHGSPKSRYGAGMLYPQHSIIKEETDSDSNDTNDLDNISLIQDSPEIEQKNRNTSMNENGSNDEEPVGLANQYLPSALGFTIRFKVNEKNDLIKLVVNSAYYERGVGKKPKKQRDKENKIVSSIDRQGNPVRFDYWTRRPIEIEKLPININSIFKSKEKSFDKVLKQTNDKRDWLKLRIFNRTSNADIKEGYRTFTFTLINEIKGTTDDHVNSEYILYQNELILETENNDLIAPYKERTSTTDTDEEKELNLLYRKKRFFAVGHGTSVTWSSIIENNLEKVNCIKTSVIPIFDIPQIAPTSHVELSMLQLSDMGDWNEAKKSLILLSDQYSLWINQMELDIKSNTELVNYKDAAIANINKCKNSLNRIQNGIKFLLDSDEDSDMVKSFRWMNRAMIWQQQRSKTKLRKWIKIGNKNNSRLKLEGIDNSDEYSFPNLKEYHNLSRFNGRWRPFQIAFILMNIDSIVNPGSKERGIVDLIWFPTGGGKTEAYLGLAAFNIFFRRIQGKKKWDWDLYGGTAALMRYTLRLLTAQQYERASSLITACDLIRSDNKDDLGEETISIGLWVGSSSTPNKNDEAKTQFNALKRDSKAEYNFVVMKCPCCGSQIGKIDGVNRYDTVKIKGLNITDGKKGEVFFQCENNSCEYFDQPLPLQVVDEMIYSYPPTLVLGTVDKFAMVTWKKETGNLFGFRTDKNKLYRILPPDLIIQDELHLISGPLGTMVGMYETMIQTLCNNYNKSEPPFVSSEENNFIPPKIIASSATISRAFDQVKSLYGIESNEQLNIFPSQGLTFGDTWFSEEKSLLELDTQGKQIYPGRKYVGILASGYPSALTSNVRTYSTVLQSVKNLSSLHSDAEIDYYWTLLGYFNTIRELGANSSLVYGDIRERLGQIQNRELVRRDQKRYINKIEELTGRISSSEIPNTLKKLEVSYKNDNNTALDICLATNMIATGVDISRLGLMFIHGQPKTSAEYIQASSRVGRDLPKGPGLIFTLYSPTKPRDKSLYEQFQGYHSRIYSNVEPTSVTPFSINARERGLHAVLIGLIRHFSEGSLKEKANISGSEGEFHKLYKFISKIILKRCEIIDKNELKNTEILLNKRMEFWKNGFDYYGDAFNSLIKKDSEIFPLMYSNSAEVRDDIIINNRSLSTSTSMRGVDAESSISIFSNNIYNGEE